MQLHYDQSFFKILDYDTKQQAEMKEYVESSLKNKFDVMECKLDVMESKLLAEIKVSQNKG